MISYGIWKYCKQELIDKEIVDSIKTSKAAPISARRKKQNTEILKEIGKMSIVYFPNWDHVMHLKCISGHKNWLYDYVVAETQ